MAWTQERVEELKRLWADGHSASQIAARMGGVTRNAVIGKVKRLGLSGREKPAEPKGVAGTRAPVGGVRTEGQTRKHATTKAASDATSLAIQGIEDNHCRWPIGDPASEDFHFCGQACAPGKTYCAYHQEMAHQPLARMRRSEGSGLIRSQHAA